MTNLEHVTAAHVIERLERALEGAHEPALAFDADGTLWRGDVGCDLFQGAIESRLFTDEALDLFRREAASIGLSEDGDATALASRLLDAFNEGRWEDGPAAVTMALSFVGVRPAALEALADEVMAKVGLRERLHPGVAEIIAWANGRSVRVQVVSASPIAAVHAAVRPLGIADDRVLAMRPRVRDDGTLGGELDGESVYGEGKVKALERALPGVTLLGAFGDSAGDAFMLRLSRVPVAVGPSQRLLDVAHTVPGLVVLPFPPRRG